MNVWLYWEANIHSTGQGIFRLVINRQDSLLYCRQKPVIAPILSYVNWNQNLKHLISKIYFNIILPSTTRSANWFCL